MKQENRLVKKYDTKASLSPNKMSRPPTTDSISNTYSQGFNKQRVNSKQSQLPEISKMSKRQQKIDNFAYSQEFQDILLIEKDERYRYLVKNGAIKKMENGGNIIFSELPQIPGIWVCYRRPHERNNNLEKLCLDCLDLCHMPLLEGEEKLKILTYQHNRIPSIQNLVSLPNLLYLDLYDNLIKEIEELKQIQKLKVLLMPKNQIRKIQNLDHFSKLEVLDLHSNRIVLMEGLKKLKALKILNLGNNLIQKIENLDDLTSLVELNLKINQVDQIDNLVVVPQLQKLYLTSNKLQYYPPKLSLVEISLENNPISINRMDYLKNCLANYEQLRFFDGKPIEVIRQELVLLEPPKTEPIKRKQLQTTSNPPQKKKPHQMALEIHGFAQEVKTKDETLPFSQIKKEHSITKDTKDTTKIESQGDEEIISLIKNQWNLEFKRIQTLERLNQLNKKTCLEHQKVEGGHAEVEEDEFLLIYGTAAAMVLPSQEFRQSIYKIHFQYLLFDSLVDQQMQTLQKYEKLRELIFKDNYINSLLQLAKLEHLQEIKSLVVLNNPINICTFLFQFLVYRFPSLLQINGKDIRPDDKQKSKLLFQNFDKSLQIPEKLQNQDNIRQLKCHKKDKGYVKQFHKLTQEVANDQKIIIKGQKAQFDQCWEEYILQLIQRNKAEQK